MLAVGFFFYKQSYIIKNVVRIVSYKYTTAARFVLRKKLKMYRVVVILLIINHI